MNPDYYKGIKKIYFKSIISNIIKIGNLNNKNEVILDFGCGVKFLSSQLPKNKVLNYDINLDYSDYSDYKALNFDVVVFNHVLMYMSKEEIIKTFQDIKRINPNCKFIVGIGKERLLNKLAAILTFNFTAHKGILTSYNEQVKILKESTKVINSKKNIFFMTDIYYTMF